MPYRDTHIEEVRYRISPGLGASLVRHTQSENTKTGPIKDLNACRRLSSHFSRAGDGLLGLQNLWADEGWSPVYGKRGKVGSALKQSTRIIMKYHLFRKQIICYVTRYSSRRVVFRSFYLKR